MFSQVLSCLWCKCQRNAPWTVYKEKKVSCADSIGIRLRDLAYVAVSRNSWQIFWISSVLLWLWCLCWNGSKFKGLHNVKSNAICGRKCDWWRVFSTFKLTWNVSFTYILTFQLILQSLAVPLTNSPKFMSHGCIAQTCPTWSHAVMRHRRSLPLLPGGKSYTSSRNLHPQSETKIVPPYSKSESYHLNEMDSCEW